MHHLIELITRIGTLTSRTCALYGHVKHAVNLPSKGYIAGQKQDANPSDDAKPIRDFLASAELYANMVQDTAQ
jgi:hypothetical protein